MERVIKKSNYHNIWIHLIFIIMCLLFVLPMILVISISLSSETSIIQAGGGFHLLPRDFSFDAYRLAFANPSNIINAYWITASQAVMGTVLSCLIIGMVAYPLSRSNFAYKKIITFLIFFTMLFNGGMIPTYIIYTQWYGLSDSYWVYILPGLAGGAWNTLIVRTFFKAIPESLFESAKIDGASEFTNFFYIAMPLSKPVFATIGFMMLVAKWNEWQTTLIYIRSRNLYTLQFLLQRILNELQFISSMMANPSFGSTSFTRYQLPNETLRYAICVIAAGPMLMCFPFFQKYFAKGLTIGAVKG